MIAEIKNYPGYFILSNGTVIGKKGNVLKPSLRSGYPCVSLYKDKKLKSINIHRLVAEAFIPNPNNYPVVNHKDENKENSDIDNLEWCTQAYNNAYGTKGERTSKAQLNRKDHSKPVLQFSLDGEFIAEYPSCKEAWRQTGVWRAHIGECCNHYKNQYTAGGYVWKWKKGANE